MFARSASSPARAETTEERDPAGRTAQVLLVSAVVLLAVNMRLVFGSVSPVLTDIQRAYGLPSVMSAVLTTGPVLLLGLLAPLAPRLATRWGARVVLAVCLGVIAFGAGVRAVPAVLPLFVGTLAAGAAIAVANVLLPGFVKKEFPHRIGAMTGVATMLISSGSGAASSATVPLQQWFGGSWQRALGVWAVPAAAAVVVWALVVWLYGSGKGGTTEDRVPATPVWREATAWNITIFMGLQSLLAYSLIAWLPTLYRDDGLAAGSAGAMLGILSITSIPTALIVPMLAARFSRQHWLAIAVVLFSVLGLLGILLLPTTIAPLWAALLGLGQGGQLGLALTLMSLRATTHAHAAAISGMAQSAGYVLASAGPVLLGVTHTLTGSWNGPIILLVVLMVPLVVVGYQAGSSPRTQR